ncbi:type I pantothenate kinase [Alginatibacterium sediminis]|uniref:Pantothenate kinase n=1 Tax=Alginatibacterium sediminis TaxID=2164068 RepID=A0A420ELD8_9ALTE|nr:type I pantothenate kinase [Alginatibacterium sediminis]RKF21404.1 type I pantothenate kinase [Alginatibacterium sediminis]
MQFAAQGEHGPLEYFDYQRSEWAQLRQSVPMTLSEDDLAKLQGINEDVSLSQVVDIYLPLSRLLNLYVKSRQDRREVITNFLGNKQHVPYIIGVSGSVAVGKSTTSRILQALLSRWPEHPKVDIVTTDGFLYPLEELKKRGLIKRKGFPESYDTKALLDFVARLKSGRDVVSAPIYSHLSYDILPEQFVEVRQPDIVILEGLNVLQNRSDFDGNSPRSLISDFLDFTIFVDAEMDLLRRWYIERFLRFRKGAFADPQSYFHSYAQLDQKQATDVASGIWDSINEVNLLENINPTRGHADLILEKGDNHQIQRVRLRK